LQVLKIGVYVRDNLLWSNFDVISADLSCRTYLVYHHGLFAQGVRKLLEEQCGVKVVGTESDVAKALKAVRSLQPDVIIIEECTGKFQPMRLGAFLHSAVAGRVVTLSLDHMFATVYQRNRIPVTILGDLVNAVRGAPTPSLPTLDMDGQRGTAAASIQPETVVARVPGARTKAPKRLTRRGDKVGVDGGKSPPKSRAR
jgi:DNA-binding NarL/FixJ family response regulator